MGVVRAWEKENITLFRKNTDLWHDSPPAWPVGCDTQLMDLRAQRIWNRLRHCYFKMESMIVKCSLTNQMAVECHLYKRLRMRFFQLKLRWSPITIPKFLPISVICHSLALFQFSASPLSHLFSSVALYCATNSVSKLIHRHSFRYFVWSVV